MFGNADLPTKYAVFLRENLVLIDSKRRVVRVDPAPPPADQIQHQEQLEALDQLLIGDRPLGTLLKALVLLDRVSEPTLPKQEVDSLLLQLQVLKVFKRQVEPKRMAIRGMIFKEPFERRKFADACAGFSDLDLAAFSDQQWQMLRYSLDALNRLRATRRVVESNRPEPLADSPGKE